jgi:hypothetical protein
MRRILLGLGLALVFTACSSDSADKVRVRERDAESGSATNEMSRRTVAPNLNMKNLSVDHRN